MALVLACNAHYVTPGDAVDVVAVLFDDTPTQGAPDGMAKPSLVRSGSCKLIGLGGQVLDEVTFEPYHANTDGAFRAFFLHPADVRGLSARVSVTVAPDDDVFSETVPVKVEQIDTNLAPQGGNR